MEPDTVPPLDPLTKVALESLKDIALPEPVSWMPQTWGWGLVAVFLLVVAVLLALRALRRYRANAYRRQALVELNGIEPRVLDPQTRHDAIGELAELLKRVALVAWKREEVATLSGAAWIDFLKRHCEAGDISALQPLLDSEEYRNGSGLSGIPDTLCKTVVSSARLWIRRHHVSA
ncbi:DUF4381 domain-containing protein [Pararhizobium sp. DWP3-4]|uniref:DUF4381 domain-containing protein n=1 Tax=Pararhizobium sp. DWP3-4 TaxID=2804565 RepID=UPI003CEABE18